MEDLKSLTNSACRNTLAARLHELATDLRNISESMESETKSPLGDKHETARARMQFEQQSLQKRIDECNEMLHDLDRLSILRPNETVTTGSLVETNRGVFYISIALGKVTVAGQEVFVISPMSPIGKLFTGSAKGNEFVVNGSTYRILAIF